MSILMTIRRPVAAAVALALVSACATNPDGSFKKDEQGNYVVDEKAKGALIGAAAGCAIGAAAGGGKGCAQGAVVGAVAGFLIAWYFESKKLKDAKSINQEYAKRKVDNPEFAAVKPKDIPQPPKNDIVPTSFTTNVKQAPPDAQGQKEVQITSNTDLIGYGDKVPEVTQKYAIYDENNKLVEEKVEKVAAVDGAGRYQTSSKFKLPAQAKGKNYTVKTELASNGKTVKQNSYKVAFADDGHIIVLAMASF